MIFIKFQNKIHVLSTNSITTIKNIKDRLNYPDIKLYSYKLLHDHHTIEHYNIKSGDTLHAFSSLKGGIPVADTLAPPGDASNIVTNSYEIGMIPVLTAIWKAETERSFFTRLGENIVKGVQFVKGMVTVAKFFPLITIVLMCLSALGRPLEFLLMIISLILCTFMYILYAFCNTPLILPIIMAGWFLIMDIVPFLVYTVIFGAIFLFISFICVLITIANIVTGGLLKNIVLCQTEPSDWYKIPNSQLSNKWERSMMCNRPCFSRYYPDPTGVMCMKTPKGFPPYCPQAEIMRIYTSKKADRNFAFNNFDDISNVNYLSKSPDERERLIKSHYMRKKDYLETCNQNMMDYKPLTLNICASADILESSKYLSNKEVQKLKLACQQAYCGANTNYPFCQKISDLKEDENSALLRKIVKIITLIIVFCLVLFFTMEYLYKN
jgi:hypothetical protein